MMRYGLLALMLSLGACSTLPVQTPFHQLGKFEQFTLNTSTYRVSFVGNGYTRQADAEEIALLQAARVSLQHGYRYFRVLDDPTHQTVIPAYVGVPSFDVYGGGPLYYRAGFFYRGPAPIDRFYGSYGREWAFPDRIQITYTIICQHEQSSDKQWFDASMIVASLGKKYGLNADGSAVSVQPVQPKTSKAAP